MDGAKRAYHKPLCAGAGDAYSLVARAPVLAAKFFTLAALTDAVDGFVARTWPSQQSAWGAFMDPVADKVLVCCALVLVASAHASNPFVGGCTMVLISRELAVSALREYAARAGQPIPVDWWGKVKTALQCVALALLLWQGPCLAESVGVGTPRSSELALALCACCASVALSAPACQLSRSLE